MKSCTDYMMFFITVFLITVNIIFVFACCSWFFLV